jgi:hypothetical protein
MQHFYRQTPSLKIYSFSDSLMPAAHTHNCMLAVTVKNHRGSSAGKLCPKSASA